MLAAGLQVSQINKHLIRRETEMKSKSRKSINILLLASVRLLLSQPSVNLLTPPPPLLRSISGQLSPFPPRRERGESESHLLWPDLGWGCQAGREGRPAPSQPASQCLLLKLVKPGVETTKTTELFMSPSLSQREAQPPNMHECINKIS